MLYIEFCNASDMPDYLLIREGNQLAMAVAEDPYVTEEAWLHEIDTELEQRVLAYAS
jgi:hypothetical protein